MRAALACTVVLMSLLCAAQAFGKDYRVCPETSHLWNCQFRGDRALQAAIDRAASGDRILIAAGRYTSRGSRDVPYKDFTVRSYILIEGKDLVLEGEPGVVLDGAAGEPATALAIHHSRVSVSHLRIEGFRYAVEEDDIYDGHGIFVIDSDVRLDDITISKCQKMALTGRGNTLLDVSGLRVLDGHLGVWLHESAYLRLTDALVRNTDSSAIAAYDHSAAHVSRSVFDDNRDDGLYTDDQATLYVTDSRVVNSQPLALHAVGESHIWSVSP